MNVKALLLVSLAVLAAVAFISSVGAYTYISPNTYFGFTGNVYVHFTEVQMADFVYKSGNYWQFSSQIGNRIITTTANMTITNDSVPLWFNYTVDGAGEQDIYFYPADEPTYALIDGVHTASGWSYHDGWLNVTGATSSAEFYFSSVEPEPPIPPQFGEMGLGGMGIYFIDGSKLCIQQEVYNLTFTVSSGSWNGTDAYFAIGEEEGYLAFTSQSNFTLNYDDEGTLGSVMYDGPSSFGIWESNSSRLTYEGNTVTISWNLGIVSVLDIYIDLGIGLSGIGLMVFGPSWVAWHIKEKGFDDVTMKRVFYLMVLFFVGLGMFMMWAMG